jgi:hypothetical protein
MSHLRKRFWKVEADSCVPHRWTVFRAIGRFLPAELEALIRDYYGDLLWLWQGREYLRYWERRHREEEEGIWEGSDY